MAYMRYVGKLVRKTKIMFTPGNQPLLSELQVGVGVGDFSCFSNIFCDPILEPSP